MVGKGQLDLSESNESYVAINNDADLVVRRFDFSFRSVRTLSLAPETLSTSNGGLHDERLE
jgi:hypothetical protein